MRSAAPPASAVASTRTWLTPGLLGLDMSRVTGEPCSGQITRLLLCAALLPLAEVESRHSTVILLPRVTDPELLPAEPLIPAVTLAELSVGPLVARSDQERAARQTQEAETDFDPIPFDAAAARAFAQLAACLRRT